MDLASWAQFGFAAVVTGFLLIRMNGTIDKLKDAVNKNSGSTDTLTAEVKDLKSETRELRRELQVGGRPAVVVTPPPR